MRRANYPIDAGLHFSSDHERETPTSAGVTHNRPSVRNDLALPCAEKFSGEELRRGGPRSSMNLPTLCQTSAIIVASQHVIPLDFSLTRSGGHIVFDTGGNDETTIQPRGRRELRGILGTRMSGHVPLCDHVWTRATSSEASQAPRTDSSADAAHNIASDYACRPDCSSR